MRNYVQKGKEPTNVEDDSVEKAGRSLDSVGV